MIPTDARGVKPLNVMFDPREIFYPNIGDLETLINSCDVQVTPKSNPDIVRHIKSLYDLKECINEIKDNRKEILDKIAELKKEIDRLEKLL